MDVEGASLPMTSTTRRRKKREASTTFLERDRGEPPNSISFSTEQLRETITVRWIGQELGPYGLPHRLGPPSAVRRGTQRPRETGGGEGKSRSDRFGISTPTRRSR
jgi:hypothetical protein